jgi:hypothetical protein
MAVRGDSYFNPASRTRLVFVELPEDNGGRGLVMDWFVAPGEWLVGAAHIHAGPDGLVVERFDLTAGSAACRIGGYCGGGDGLPFRGDDPRLEPGYTPTGDPEVDEVAIDELALARARVLSPEGRDAAAERWYRGSRGPTSPGAVASASECLSCGFLIPLAGPMGQLFGVCANEWSPDDGKVVSLDHGCGAHSETDVETRPSEWPDQAPLVDDGAIEAVTAEG